MVRRCRLGIGCGWWILGCDGHMCVCRLFRGGAVAVRKQAGEKNSGVCVCVWVWVGRKGGKGGKRVR